MESKFTIKVLLSYLEVILNIQTPEALHNIIFRFIRDKKFNYKYFYNKAIILCILLVYSHQLFNYAKLPNDLKR